MPSTELSVLQAHKRSGGVGRILRSLGVAATVVALAPVIVILVLSAFGGIVGISLAESLGGSVAWGAAVAVLLTLVAIIALVFGVVAVARVQAGDRFGVALGAAVLGLPRLLVVLIATIALMLLCLLVWPAIVVGMLVLALVLRLRHRSGVRAALLCAIPFAPVLLGLAFLPSAIAAATTRPGSTRRLVVTAVENVRQRPLRIAAFFIVSGLLSAGLSWAGTAVSGALDADLKPDQALLAIAVTLALLIATTGVALAVFLPPRNAQPRAERGTSRRTRLLGRVATLVIVSLVTSLAPVMSAASPASADPLITPVLILGFDGGGPKPTLTAEVTVPGGDPSGSVQFFDGATPIGSPTRVVPAEFDATTSYTRLMDVPFLAPGDHQISFQYTPDSPLVESGLSSAPRAWHFTATTVMSITADVDAGVGNPADVTVTLAANFATTVTPDGTVIIEWDGGSDEVALIGGIAQVHIPELTTPDVTATYAGSSNFRPVTKTVQIGVVLLPEPTQTAAYLSGSSFTLGDSFYASATVTAPNAAWGTEVTGTVQVWAGSTLLVEAPVGDQLLVPTASLHAGDTDLRFEYVPDYGFTGSEATVSVSISAATTSVSSSLSASTAAWGAPLSLTVSVASSLDGDRTVEVWDTLTGTLFSTQVITIAGGVATSAIDLAPVLRMGNYSLEATVLGDSDRVAATAASQNVYVSEALTATSFTLSAGPYEIDRPITVSASTTTVAGLPDGVTGVVTFRFPDGTQQQISTSNGQASAEWTPSSATTGNITVSFFDSGFNFAGSSKQQSVTIVNAVAPAPSVVWTGSLTPADRSVTLTYTAASGRSVPTGFARILDEGGAILAQGELVDGVVTIEVSGTVGARPVLSALYLGDSVYGTRTDVLPVTALTNYLPVVTFDAPATADLGEPFAVSVSVGDVPLSLIESVEIINTDDGGLETSLGAITLDVAGSGTRTVTPLADGTSSLRAVVTFSAASELPAASSDAATVTVPPVPQPNLVITSPTPTASLVAGGTVTLDVTALFIGPGTTGVPAGTTARVLDDTGAVLGTVTLLGAAGVDGYTGQLQVTNVHGGPLIVHAEVTYGPLDATAVSPALGLVIAPPAVTLVIQTDTVNVGSSLTATVSAYPPVGASGPTRSLNATVTFEGNDYSLVLTRSGATGPFSGTVALPTTHAGEQTIYASTPGNSVDAGPATDDYFMQVLKRPTTLDVRVASSSAAGEDVVVYAKPEQSGPGISPTPTGAITVTASRGGASCTVDETYTCTIPGSQVFEGVTEFYAWYPGDVDNLDSTGSAEVTLGARSSSLNVVFSPATGWVAGEPVTATWTTTTSGRTAVGSVHVNVGGVSCDGEAAAGSCTVRPYSAATTGPVESRYRVSFVPSDDAPPAEVSGTTLIEICTYPHIVGVATDVDARHCGDAGRGLVSGSRIKLTADYVPDRYVVDHWISGDTVITGRTPTVTVNTTATYVPVYRYAPVCFTLTLTPPRADRATHGGYLVSNKTPNCDSPNGPTAQDKLDIAAGRPRYAAGTVVDMLVSADAGMRLAQIDGAGMLNNFLAAVTMTKDTTVSAVFEVTACSPVSVFPTEGGSVVITSATRPTSSAFLSPATGACTTWNGKPGYVPGTVLTFTATPEGAGAVYSWVAHEGHEEISAWFAGVIAVSGKSTARGPLTYTYTVGEKPAQIFARFEQVKCVMVTLISRSQVSPYYTMSEELAPRGIDATAYNSELGCGGYGGSRTVTFSADRKTRIVTTTMSYVADGRLQVNAPQPVYTRIGGYFPNTYVTWSTKFGQSGVGEPVGALLRRGWDRYDDGPLIDLAAAGSQVTITGKWMLTGCAAPTVVLPQGGSYTLEATGTPEEQLCQTPGTTAAHSSALRLVGTKPVLAPLLVPILTSPNGTWAPTPQNVSAYGTYMLEYCVPLGIDLRILDDKGVSRAASAAELDALVADDGGCPNGWTRPSRTTRTALSPAGSAGYTVVGNPEGFGPTRVVDPFGNVSGTTLMQLKVICYTVTVDDASITTPGNCPGGAPNRFLRGTQVQVQAGDADRFDGWSGADAQQGETAWVVMYQDRSVTADLYNYKWYEKVGNALSSFAQRAAAALVTVATGIVLAEAYLLKSASWVLKGTSAILTAAGVDGKGIDVINRISTTIDAQFDAMNLLADCASSAATSGSPPLLQVTLPTGTSPMPTGTASAEQFFEYSRAQLQNELVARGVKSISIDQLMGDKGAMINLFTSGSYTGDARSSWNAFGKSIGECTQRGLTTYVNTTYG